MMTHKEIAALPVDKHTRLRVDIRLSENMAKGDPIPVKYYGQITGNDPIAKLLILKGQFFVEIFPYDSIMEEVIHDGG